MPRVIKESHSRALRRTVIRLTSIMRDLRMIHGDTRIEECVQLNDTPKANKVCRSAVAINPYFS